MGNSNENLNKTIKRNPSKIPTNYSRKVMEETSEETWEETLEEILEKILKKIKPVKLPTLKDILKQTEVFWFYYSDESIEEYKSIHRLPNNIPEVVFPIELKIDNDNSTITIKETSDIPYYEYDYYHDFKEKRDLRLLKNPIIFRTDIFVKNKLNQDEDDEIEIEFDNTEIKNCLSSFGFEEACFSIFGIRRGGVCCIVVPSKKLWIKF